MTKAGKTEWQALKHVKSSPQNELNFELVKCMSFKVTRILVSKGVTTGDEKAGRWNRVHYEVEMAIQDERDIEQARAAAEGLVDGWLAGEPVQHGAKTLSETKPPAKDLTRLPYNIDRIPWQDRHNENGDFQLCNDESNADFLALRAFVLQHAGGKISTRDSQGLLWYVWVFQDQKVLGRKKSQFVKRK